MRALDRERPYRRSAFAQTAVSRLPLSRTGEENELDFGWRPAQEGERSRVFNFP
jgi:hypothetical protein